MKLIITAETRRLQLVLHDRTEAFQRAIDRKYWKTLESIEKIFWRRDLNKQINYTIKYF